MSFNRWFNTQNNVTTAFCLQVVISLISRQPNCCTFPPDFDSGKMEANVTAVSDESAYLSSICPLELMDRIFALEGREKY